MASEIQPHCPRVRIPYGDYTMCNTETNNMAERGHKTFTCTTEHTRLGTFLTGKKMKHKTGLKIFMIFLLFLTAFSYAENLNRSWFRFSLCLKFTL